MAFDKMGNMILLIDNYDSFTWNVVHLLQDVGAKVETVRNDQISVEAALKAGDEGIILSPGPCTPDKAGICVPLVEACMAARHPLLGICLGHQAIIAAAGGKIIRAPQLMHGKTSAIRHSGKLIFADLPDPLVAARYHSLVGKRQDLPTSLQIIAEAEEDGQIMGVEVKDAPLYGVQFHPESIATQGGAVLMRNFLTLAANSQHPLNEASA